MLPLAVGVALSPVSVIAVALMLMSRRARLNGPGFVLGWLADLAVIGAAVGMAQTGILAGLRFQHINR